MGGFNIRSWRAFAVLQPEQAPAGPHSAAVLFDTRTDWQPGYDKGDPDTTMTVAEVVYFAFADKGDLARWIGEATAARRKFFFFHVAKMGEARVSVDVELG